MKDRVVVVTGAGGPAGVAACERLSAAGATVVAADVDDVRLHAAPAASHEVIDLLDADAVRKLAGRMERVDGLIHLVGGWRGADSFAETSLEDYTVLHDLLFRTLQHTTLAFRDALAESPHGRFAMVTARMVSRPGQTDAAYAAAKAAAEAWTLSMADSLRGTAAAASILVVKALGDRPGFTTPAALADAIAGLWDRSAEALNGERLPL